eukprot:TRINITY_DN93115_c0_g1_i1.p1 TRINITY_DN93115_c0_g1~~TRINITY_DN93115_c0_g1_i1.p1  ORF type:complete len:571 (-),score=116.88 TRINITY_DN93115_c0_g1_i1:220-1932(-)
MLAARLPCVRLGLLSGYWPSRVAHRCSSDVTRPDAATYINMVLNAKVYDVCKRTELHHAPGLSKATGNKVLLKREDQQSVYSFKLRGAYNKIVHLSAEEKSRGICACSAGNHAQGVAFSAAALGVSAKIFMPKTTPSIKVDAVRRYANDLSEVILVGDSYDEAYAATLACIEEESRVLVHPFNDPLVIAGQGTIGKEILEQTTKEEVDAVFCCVGGGGLLSGVGVFLKTVKPSIKVIGVEAIDSAAMTESLHANELIELPSVGLFADGAAVRKVGDETFRLCQMFADEMITVSTDEICAAIKDSFIDTRVVLEPAGALAAAGLKKYALQNACSEKTLVAVTSGANMDFDRLRFVSERADTSETLIAVQIPERSGAFIDLYRHIYPRNVTEFSYRISGDPASIFMSFQASSPEDRTSVLDALRQSGYDPLHLDENELAKTHGRHLVGGRAPAELTEEEGLFSFEFPERPGALLRFLENLPTDFNVSLFHYRSHGADVARVLVAVQVPVRQRQKFRDYLDFLVSKGYSWTEETENEIYCRFLLEPVDGNTSGRSRPRRPPPLTLMGSSVSDV